MAAAGDHEASAGAMTTPTLADALEQSLRDAEASHLAHVEADGPDPDWPHWYTNHLAAIFGDRYGYEQLLTALRDASRAHGIYEETRLGHYDKGWPRWYAEHMAAALDGTSARLASGLAAMDDE